MSAPVICKNCGQSVPEKYCGSCGQSAETHKMNFHFLWHDIQHGLFHFDKGVLYTAKELFTRPGNTVRGFLEGKRVRHFKPISFVVILATLYGLLYNYFNISPGAFFSNSEKAKKAFEMVNHWIATHYAFSTLFMLPLYTLASYLVFKKQGYNFVEHFILNAYLSGQRLIAHLVLLPFWYFNNESLAIKYISFVVDFVLLIWGYTSMFNKMGKLKGILLSVSAYLLFFVFLITVSLLAGIIIAMYIK
jgi:Protein of unknown function (DUF3667)